MSEVFMSRVFSSSYVFRKDSSEGMHIRNSKNL